MKDEEKNMETINNMANMDHILEDMELDKMFIGDGFEPETGWYFVKQINNTFGGWFAVYFDIEEDEANCDGAIVPVRTALAATMGREIHRAKLPNE